MTVLIQDVVKIKMSLKYLNYCYLCTETYSTQIHCCEKNNTRKTYMTAILLLFTRGVKMHRMSFLLYIKLFQGFAEILHRRVDESVFEVHDEF